MSNHVNNTPYPTIVFMAFSLCLKTRQDTIFNCLIVGRDNFNTNRSESDGFRERRDVVVDTLEERGPSQIINILSVS